MIDFHRARGRPACHRSPWCLPHALPATSPRSLYASHIARGPVPPDFAGALTTKSTARWTSTHALVVLYRPIGDQLR